MEAVCGQCAEIGGSCRDERGKGRDRGTSAESCCYSSRKSYRGDGCRDPSTAQEFAQRTLASLRMTEVLLAAEAAVYFLGALRGPFDFAQGSLLKRRSFTGLGRWWKTTKQSKVKGDGQECPSHTCVFSGMSAFYNWRPMKLLLKFNLVLILVFAVGIGIAGYFSREFLERNAREQVLQQARLMMGAAGGMRTYTSQ